MKPQIVLTRLEDRSFQWIVYAHENIVAMGYGANAFEAFKAANAVMNKL